MAYAHKALNRAQISNVEGTPGSAEAATEILFYENLSQLSQDKVWYTPVQDRGSLAKNIETPYQVSQLAEFEMDGDFYDRLAVFLFSNAIRGNVTPTQPDNVNEPNHYLWSFEPALGTPNTPDQTNGIDTFTLEWGNNIQAYETPYIFTTQLEISGAPDELVKFTWSFQGRGVTETTFTGALTAPTTHQFFAFNKAKWYVDSSYAGIGTTQKTGVLKGFTWTFETMFTARFTADGNYYFSALNEDRKAPQLELILMRDSTHFEAELDKYLAASTSFQRIELLAPTEMDSGQANPPYVYLDGAWKYTEWPELDEEDGNQLITVSAEAWLDPTAAKMFGCSVGTRMSAFA